MFIFPDIVGLIPSLTLDICLGISGWREKYDLGQDLNQLWLHELAHYTWDNLGTYHTPDPNTFPYLFDIPSMTSETVNKLYRGLFEEYLSQILTHLSQSLTH